MSEQSLEEALQASGSPVERLRNSQIGPYAFPVVRPEFTNWRDEQRAWKETCALLDQSHHMADLYLEGPEALKVLSDLAINSFKNFKVNQAKQFVACNHQGYVIGDAILFYLDENKFNLVGRPPALNWVQYKAETGGYKAKAERDERSAVNQGRRRTYRYPDPGTARATHHGEGDGKAGARYPLLQYGCLPHSGPQRPGIAARDGGSAGLGTIWALGGRRRGSCRDCRSRPGIRDSTGRIESLPHHVSRVRLDSVAAAGDLYR